MRTRFAVAYRRPVVVIDFRSMSARMVERRDVPTWKRRLDKAVYRSELDIRPDNPEPACSPPTSRSPLRGSNLFPAFHSVVCRPH